MKKITFLLIALITGTTFAQDDSGTATVNAHIVEVINIENGTALNFGSIVASTGGKVRVNTASERTFSNPDMKVISATTVAAAGFDVTAANGYSYSISIPSIELTGTGNPMFVEFTHDLEGQTDGNATGTGAIQKLKVGGLITVAPGQTAGDYDGTVEVTVSYE